MAIFLLTMSSQAQQKLTAPEALRKAFSQRGTMTANRLKLEQARFDAGASAAYPATRLEAGRDLFGPIDVMGGADFLLSQPIDIFGKTQGLRGQARAAVAVAMATYRQSALDLQQQVLITYANLLSAQRLLTLGKQQRDLAQAVLTLTNKRVQARDLPEVQSTRAGLEVQKAELIVSDRQATAETAALKFASALGSDAEVSAELSSLIAPAYIGGVESRPEILSLKAEENQASADSRVARQSQWPDLDLQAGRTSFNTPAEYGARLQLTVSLWDFGANRNKIRSSNAKRKAANAAYHDAYNAAQKDVQAASIELAAAERSVAGYQKLAGDAKALLDRTQHGFELGASTLLDVIDARRALSDAQELTINAQLRQDLAIEGLLRSQGLLLENPK